MKIIPTVFKGIGQYGDFEHMILSGKFDDSLFIFNDNEEHHFSDVQGGGNAVIRKYNKNSTLLVPRSAGVPTGSLKHRGYQKLGPHEKFVIDFSINEIKELIKQFGYKRIYFSANTDGILSSKIFSIDDKVKKYITDEIMKLK